MFILICAKECEVVNLGVERHMTPFESTKTRATIYNIKTKKFLRPPPPLTTVQWKFVEKHKMSFETWPGHV